MRGRFVIALAVVALAACASPSAVAPMPTWPVSPELLPTAASGGGEAQVTCGERSFPLAGLTAPADAARAVGPEFDALRAAFAQFGREFDGAATWPWRLAGEDGTGAIFLARTDALGEPGWVSAEAEHADGWRVVTMGQCRPHVVLSPELGPATWAFDPAYPRPDAATTELHILVWEQDCSGGAPTTGRMSAPVVEYAQDSVTITIGVRPVQLPPGTAVACPMPPGTPASLVLAEPLGRRTLLDGGILPPAPPSPANPG